MTEQTLHRRPKQQTMFQNSFFQDSRHRKNRIRMAMMIPFAVAMLAGIGVLLFLQRQTDIGKVNPISAARPESAPTPTPASKPVPKADPSAVSRATIEAAVAAFKADDLDRTQKLLENVDLEQAASPSGWELAGLVNERKGDKAAALKVFSRGIAVNPSEGLYYRRALIYRGNEDFERALDDMDRALSFSPVDIVISNERLLLLVQMGKTEQAAKELTALSSLGMDPKGRIFALCGIALENKDFAQAASLLELAKKAVPAQVFEQMLKNPVIARYQMRPEITPFYFGNISP